MDVVEHDESVGAVTQWTGREVRALRESRRMSVREFARHLGVSDRMVSKWEAGGSGIRPRPVNQAALDTSLVQATDDDRARFAVALDGGPHRTLGPHRTIGSPGAVGSHGTAGDGRSDGQPMTHVVRHPYDGKLMILIESGPYRSGPANQDRWLAGFYLDVFPTSNADYAVFVAATGHPAPKHWSPTGPALNLAGHPVVNVSWADAQAYATWSAKELPTGYQWEKAARGSSGEPYPWGDHSGSARANLREARLGTTTAVDRYDIGVSGYGIYDLYGNAAEWCASEAPTEWETRGGGFRASLADVRYAAAVHRPADSWSDDVGFRCAVPLEAMLELLAI